MPDPVAEVHALGVAAVLAADADLQPGRRERPFSMPIFTSWPTPSWSSDWKGSAGRMSLLEVVGEEGVDVVAAEAEGHLRQVVGAEGEEVGDLGDLVGRERHAGSRSWCRS
jgi:hypothetical protein